MIDQPSQKFKNFPELPGVYIMRDATAEIIYVGKAIRLKSRVMSYFQGRDDRLQIESLLERVTDIEFIVTKDERQALVLEADLIRKNQPRFNVRLRDDKSPLLIKIDLDVDWPRVQLVRQKLNDGAKYFGPFPFSYEARTLMDILERTIPLRTCSDKVMKNRVRPCLQYQIQRCSAPCCLSVDKEEYSDWVDQAISILKGDVDKVAANLVKSIDIASGELRFEDAALLRDRLNVLKKINSEVTNVMYGDQSIDAFGIYREGNLVEVSILRTEFGRLADSFSFGFEDVSIDNSAILASVISQFYNSVSPIIPTEIVVAEALEDEDLIQIELTDIIKKKVDFYYPQKGIKKKLLDLANTNAKESFEARFSGKSKLDRILKSLKDTFKLEQYPRVIECIDISHIQGKATVGAVVCFRDGKPDPTRYRYFHLSQEGKPDDFASMNEVVRRHLTRTNEEATTSDLIIIDGGPPQLMQALKVRKELGVLHPALISLAKKRVPLKMLRQSKNPRGDNKLKKPERVYVEDNPIPVILDPNNEVLKLLERIRDETHRSAITFHRKTRSKLQFKSPLDSIKGLGPKKKILLLKIFGSIENLKKAKVEEMIEKGKITRKLADLIKNTLNDKN